MSSHTLTTPKEADLLVARMFQNAQACNVQVREDKAFPESEWLDLGLISVESNATSADQLIGAVRRGAFEWTIPKIEKARSELTRLLNLKSDGKPNPKLSKALNSIAAISVRAGLQHPRFDPNALEGMPFRRSTTVVADTSGVVQGGLDFIARYLHPAARVKVPAIVQMEIVNFADRFLIGLRDPKIRSIDLLIDHLMSQGGQRVLLRLELQADTEVERTFLLGDPIRDAFQSDKDPELRGLNLNVSIRAYADRLILEAARQHQAQANLGHKVQLLTSDQGLARMALAEGVLPLFFMAVKAEDLFGSRLTGLNLDPFSGSLHETSITSLIWELATAFGSARLITGDANHSLIVSAIGKDLSWSPYQSHADLLWCDPAAVPSWSIGSTAKPSTAEIASKTASTTSNKKTVTKRPTSGSRSPVSELVGTSDKVPLPRFNINKLFSLVDALDNDQALSEEKVVDIVNARSREGIEEYRRFLKSGSLVSVLNQSWNATPQLQELAISLRNENIDGAKAILLATPSFGSFARHVSNTLVGTKVNQDSFGRAITTYRTLGEAMLLCAEIEGEGIYSTPNSPDAEHFAPIALQRFRNLDNGDGLVATGEWFESLIRKDGIHPEIARQRLNDASARELLRRSTEGSTTDVRFDRHVIHVLRVESGKPAVITVHLYRGDYLIPGKSSTSLRIEGI